MADTKKKGKKQPLSLAEFRAWLSGVEDLHPKDWHPDAAQWKIIRDKMMCIEETVVEQPLPVVYQTNVGAPTNAGTVPGFVPPPPVGGIPEGEVSLSPEAKKLLTGTGSTNVDTSNGQYSSSFG